MGLCLYILLTLITSGRHGGTLVCHLSQPWYRLKIHWVGNDVGSLIFKINSGRGSVLRRVAADQERGWVLTTVLSVSFCNSGAWLIFPPAQDSILSPFLPQKWYFPCHILLLHTHTHTHTHTHSAKSKSLILIPKHKTFLFGAGIRYTQLLS